MASENSTTPTPPRQDEGGAPPKTIQIPIPAKLLANGSQSQQQPLSNPYNNIANYSHEATTVPPYVLYGIANSRNDPSERHNQNSGLQDPFLSSMNNNWKNFLDAVDSTPAYAEGVLNHDVEALGGLPDLSGKWGGGERLKQYMNSGHLEKRHSGSGSGSGYRSSDSDSDYQKSRSKAGYWMSTEKREQWAPYLKRVFLYNNYVPLVFRLFIIILSIVALVLSVNIYKISKKKVSLVGNGNDEDVLQAVSQQPSTIMTICVQSIALVYLLYITYDEFNSKPLGIRNPVEKMRLILLDLLFIIFSSANISLTFNTLYDHRWVCSLDEYSRYPKVESICGNQRALSAFLFLILTAWVITFTISIMRVITKVAPS